MGGSDRGLRKDLEGNNERRCGVVREAARAWQAQLDAAKLTRRAARRLESVRALGETKN